MRNLKIVRCVYSEAGTFGVMIDHGRNPLDPGEAFAVTAELPWLDNEPNKSCIPTGLYICQRVLSPKFGDTFEITKVTGRSHILFHKGNLPLRDLRGCVAVAESFERFDGQPGVAQSGKGYREFLLALTDAL
jgi:hypothetical protein